MHAKAVLGSLLFVVGAVSNAQAQSDKRAVGAILDGLQWGDDVATVIAHYRKRIEATYQSRLDSALDTAEKDRLHKEIEHQVKQVERSERKFTGQKTGLEIAIVGKEFKHNTGESVLQIRDEQADRYLFFIGGKLWKIFFAYDSAAVVGMPFPAFVRKVETKYGPARRKDKKRRAARRVVVAAHLRDKTTSLEVRDETELYQTYAMIASDRNVLARIDDLRGRTTTTRADPTDALLDRVTFGVKPDEAPERPVRQPDAEDRETEPGGNKDPQPAIGKKKKPGIEIY